MNAKDADWEKTEADFKKEWDALEARAREYHRKFEATGVHDEKEMKELNSEACRIRGLALEVREQKFSGYRKDYWKRNIRAIVAYAAITGLGLLLIVPIAAKKFNTHVENMSGGAECDPLWKAANAKESERHDAVLNILYRGNYANGMVSKEAIDKYMEKRSLLDKEATDKIQQWRACVARKQQKNVPVAVQPKAIPRGKNTL